MHTQTLSSAMLKYLKISQATNKFMDYISISPVHHLCQFGLSYLTQVECKSNYVSTSTCLLLTSCLITDLMTTRGCLILCPMCKLDHCIEIDQLHEVLTSKKKKLNNGEQRYKWFI